MESYGLEMDDLFDDREASQVLDEFEQEGEENPNNVQDLNDSNQDGDGDISRQVAEKLQQIGKGAAKKRILKPQPKLDDIRLTGERGIPILPKVFEDVKYKGKGHEVADLNKMMGIIEHWAHRMFPKMPFDEIIERIEKLGQKRAVQTVVNKIRLDMPVLTDDFVTQQASDEERDNVDDEDPVRLYEDSPTYHPVDNSHADDDEVLDEILQQEANKSTLIAAASTPNQKEPVVKDKMGLTPDQLERIKRNQELAKQRRLQKDTAETSMPDDESTSMVVVHPLNNEPDPDISRIDGEPDKQDDPDSMDLT